MKVALCGFALLSVLLLTSSETNWNKADQHDHVLPEIEELQLPPEADVRDAGSVTVVDSELQLPPEADVRDAGSVTVVDSELKHDLKQEKMVAMQVDEKAEIIFTALVATASFVGPLVLDHLIQKGKDQMDPDGDMAKYLGDGNQDMSNNVLSQKMDQGFKDMSYSVRRTALETQNMIKTGLSQLQGDMKEGFAQIQGELSDVKSFLVQSSGAIQKSIDQSTAKVIGQMEHVVQQQTCILKALDLRQAINGIQAHGESATLCESTARASLRIFLNDDEFSSAFSKVISGDATTESIGLSTATKFLKQLSDISAKKRTCLKDATAFVDDNFAKLKSNIGAALMECAKDASKAIEATEQSGHDIEKQNEANGKMKSIVILIDAALAALRQSTRAFMTRQTFVLGNNYEASSSAVIDRILQVKIELDTLVHYVTSDPHFKGSAEKSKPGFIGFRVWGGNAIYGGKSTGDKGCEVGKWEVADGSFLPNGIKDSVLTSRSTSFTSGILQELAVLDTSLNYRDSRKKIIKMVFATGDIISPCKPTISDIPNEPRGAFVPEPSISHKHVYSLFKKSGLKLGMFTNPTFPTDAELYNPAITPDQVLYVDYGTMFLGACHRPKQVRVLPHESCSGWYKFVSTERNWVEAEADCASRGGGHLASIGSAIENSEVQGLCKDQSYCWIGGTKDGVQAPSSDSDEQLGWKWSSGQTATYTNFQANGGQRVDAPSQPALFMLVSTGLWQFDPTGVQSSRRRRRSRQLEHPYVCQEGLYTSEQDANAACLREGCTGLASKSDMKARGSYCGSQYTSDFHGWYMTESKPGCGSQGFNSGAGSSSSSALCTGCPACVGDMSCP